MYAAHRIRAETAAVSRGTSHATTNQRLLVHHFREYKKNALYKKKKKKYKDQKNRGRKKKEKKEQQKEKKKKKKKGVGVGVAEDTGTHSESHTTRAQWVCSRAENSAI